MSKRSKATNITLKVRQEIHKRDRRCVACGSKNMLQIAHIYLPRSRGGLGVEENLALLCVKCHMAYDNGRQAAQEEVKNKVIAYMESRYGKPDLEKLKYKKEY